MYFFGGFIIYANVKKIACLLDVARLLYAH